VYNPVSGSSKKFIKKLPYVEKELRKKFEEGKEGFFIVAFGGIVISVIEYLIPGLLYLKIIPDLSKNQRYMNVILYSVMIVFGLAISSLGLILVLR
jgi:hypothetical protein